MIRGPKAHLGMLQFMGLSPLARVIRVRVNHLYI
jgi:hypothetical protein